MDRLAFLLMLPELMLSLAKYCMANQHLSLYLCARGQLTYDTTTSPREVLSDALG